MMDSGGRVSFTSYHHISSESYYNNVIFPMSWEVNTDVKYMKIVSGPKPFPILAAPQLPEPPG